MWIKSNQKLSILSKKPLLLITLVALLIGALFVGYIYFQDEKIKEKTKEQYLQEVNMNQKRAHDGCMKVADIDYANFVKFNGKKVSDKGKDVYELSQDKWDYAEKIRRDAKASCVKEFPEK